VKVYHLNCGTMHGFGCPLDDDTGGFFKRGYGVTHCLLIETTEGLVLVDTGWGTCDCTDPSPAVKQFMNITHCTGDIKETARKQIEGLGYNRDDVKHIFLTHLHMDHAGGLMDFPDATIHVFAAELDAFLHPQTLMERRAYRPEHAAHHPKWQTHTLGSERWFGLDCAAPIRIGETDFVMIPFIGHTRGHCGVAVRMGDEWLMHCGDAYGYYRQILAQPYRHPSGRLMETIVTTGFKMPKRHWVSISNLLREHPNQIQAFCSHDAHEFTRLAN
jgi:glyoxylase-like metal-dependent hydrolase (beta-lactamase superfamily II)